MNRVLAPVTGLVTIKEPAATFCVGAVALSLNEGVRRPTVPSENPVSKIPDIEPM